MPFTVERIDRLFIVRWTDLALDDPQRVFSMMQAAYDEAGPQLYVGVVAPYARVPNREERRALDALSKSAGPLCEAVYVVFEGDSLRHKLQRTAITGVRLLLLQNKKPTTVHKSLEDVIPDAARRIGQPVDALRAMLSARKLI
jgi:hypothetical protein